MAAKEKDFHPAHEFYNRGLDSLDQIVERQPSLTPFLDALRELNTQGNYFQERPRQEMPLALPTHVSLSSAFDRLDRHIPVSQPRTDEGPYQQLPLPLWARIMESRAIKYTTGIVFAAGVVVMGALQIQMSNLEKTQAIYRQAEQSQLEAKIATKKESSPVKNTIRFAHPLTDRERAHTIPLVKSPVQNWPDEVGLEYDRLNNLHDQLKELNYKSVHDKYHPIEEYVVSVCGQLGIADTDLALALLGSGWVVNSLEYEDKGTIRREIKEKLQEFTRKGLSKFLEKEIVSDGEPTEDYFKNAQTRYERLFREYEALQGYHQELHNKKEQNKNTALDTNRIKKPSLRYPQAGASRLEWPEQIPCPNPLYQQQHLQDISIGNGRHVVNPGGKYLVTPTLTRAASENMVTLEIAVSNDGASGGYYALSGGRPNVIEIPAHIQPGTYRFDIFLRFRDQCEQWYKSTLHVTNEVFDKAQDQPSQEGITMKKPHVYD